MIFEGESTKGTDVCEGCRCDPCECFYTPEYIVKLPPIRPDFDLEVEIQDQLLVRDW